MQNESNQRTNPQIAARWGANHMHRGWHKAKAIRVGQKRRFFVLARARMHYTSRFSSYANACMAFKEFPKKIFKMQFPYLYLKGDHCANSCTHALRILIFILRECIHSLKKNVQNDQNLKISVTLNIFCISRAGFEILKAILISRSTDADLAWAALAWRGSNENFEKLKIRPPVYSPWELSENRFLHFMH